MWPFDCALVYVPNHVTKEFQHNKTSSETAKSINITHRFEWTLTCFVRAFKPNSKEMKVNYKRLFISITWSKRAPVVRHFLLLCEFRRKICGDVKDNNLALMINVIWRGMQCCQRDHNHFLDYGLKCTQRVIELTSAVRTPRTVMPTIGATWIVTPGSINSFPLRSTVISICSE